MEKNDNVVVVSNVVKTHWASKNFLLGLATETANWAKSKHN
jgi:hypothetical protein